ncbi:MAG: YihY/virulence factor BrkB family protein, partial [Pseudomonadota bacterium]|nr:YihY/virulence factor BrkB family protein [Pseudomonadota bacterium]
MNELIGYPRAHWPRHDRASPLIAIGTRRYFKHRAERGWHIACKRRAQMSKGPSFNEWWALIKRAFAAWVEDYAPSMGAALSYYTVFSLAPVLLIVISIAGLIFGAEAARGEIFGQLRGLMGVDAAKAIEDILTSVNEPA